MNRSDILEAMYEVIKDSTEWGVSCEDGSYGEYVDGVVAMTEALLNKHKIKEVCMLEKLENFEKCTKLAYEEDNEV